MVSAHRAPAPITEDSPTPAPRHSANQKPESQEIRTPAKKDVSAADSSISAITAKLKELVNRWVEAVLSTHDISVLKSILADDFVFVDATGMTRNKAAYVDWIKGITFDFLYIEKINVRVTGPTMAVVDVIDREKATTKNGKAWNGSYRFTATWMERNGHWQCVASQAVLVSQ